MNDAELLAYLWVQTQAEFERRVSSEILAAEDAVTRLESLIAVLPSDAVRADFRQTLEALAIALRGCRS